MNRMIVLIVTVLTVWTGPVMAESGFLNDYSILVAQASEVGSDRIYASPRGDEALAGYVSVMVDQPEIHFAADSPYRGLKPEDVEAIAAILRDNLVEKVKASGFEVVEEAGPNVLFLRTALSDLYLKKKKRRIYSYTPMGAAVKVGTDALRATLDKVDIIEMSLEAELTDSQTGELFGAAVLDRGARKARGQKEERMDMDELRATVQEYGARLGCRIGNSKRPVDARIDCFDAEARERS